jgi:hypothetical protein
MVFSILSKEPIYVNENTKIKRIKETARDKHLEKIEQIKSDTLAAVIAALRQEKGEKSEKNLEMLNNLDPNNEEFITPLKYYRDKLQQKMAEQRAEEAKTERVQTAKRRIESQFSSWDGSHTALKNLIKSNMHDASSFEHVETKYWTMSDHIVVLTRFRGKNAFGAMVLNYAKAKYDFNGKFIELLTMAAE